VTAGLQSWGSDRERREPPERRRLALAERDGEQSVSIRGLLPGDTRQPSAVGGANEVIRTGVPLGVANPLHEQGKAVVIRPDR